MDVDLHPAVPCRCVNVAMGSYDAHVTLLAPWGKFVGIDACLAPLVLELWAAGIRTIASCCGHGGQAPQSLIVRIDE